MNFGVYEPIFRCFLITCALILIVSTLTLLGYLCSRICTACFSFRIPCGVLYYFNFIPQGKGVPFSQPGSAIPDLSISHRLTTLQYSYTLTLSELHVSRLHNLPKLHRMEYTHSLVICSSIGSFTQTRYLLLLFFNTDLNHMDRIVFVSSLSLSVDNLWSLYGFHLPFSSALEYILCFGVVVT